MTVFETLLETKKKKGAGYFILIDPDKTSLETLPKFLNSAVQSGVDGFLVGGSLLLTPDFEVFLETFKKNSNGVPVIIFPGGVHQISSHADAILFLSLLSGRSAQHIIGSQVLAAPIIHRAGLEAISTAYLLVESGRATSAEFMSGTTPLPRHKPEIAVAHALAASYMGFKLIYLEGGSGADQCVPDTMILNISKAVSTPLIVGGGVRTPETAADKVKAGASFIVTGNILEENPDTGLIKAFADAIHQS